MLITCGKEGSKSSGQKAGDTLSGSTTDQKKSEGKGILQQATDAVNDMVGGNKK